jgi:hypothetical protein
MAQHGGMAAETKSQRLYQRVRPGSGEAAKAQIIVGPKLPVIACRLVDYSRGGACLEVSPVVTLPERFELRHGGVKKKKPPGVAARHSDRRGVLGRQSGGATRRGARPVYYLRCN